LTARQTIRYATLLRLGPKATAEDITAAVDEVLAELHLEECADVKIGSELNRGLSGGQKKRVSIGIDLVAKPRILLVDELTSGLDSSLAEDLMRLMKALARSRRMMIVCAIHQPSLRIYNMFDSVLLLHHGRVVYSGRAGETIQKYFGYLGVVPLPQENPLELYMREIQDDTKGPQLIEAWCLHELNKASICDKCLSKDDHELEAPTRDERASRWYQFKILFQRTAHNQLLDPRLFWGSAIMKLASSLLIGLVFINQGQGTSASAVTATLAAMFFIVLQQEFTTQLKVMAEIPLVRAIARREIRNGASDFGSYLFCSCSYTHLF